MFSSVQATVLARYTLPDYNKTVEYVQNLIGSYNALLQNSTYITRPDFFDSVYENLTLYHDAQHSFQVVVLQSVPNSDYVALIFAPIQANQPNVTMDYDDTFNDLFPHTFTTVGEYALLEKTAIGYGNLVIQVPLILLVLATDISSNFATSAKNAAQFIYQQDIKQIPSHYVYKRTNTETIGVGAEASANKLTPTNPNFVTIYLPTTSTTTLTTGFSTMIVPNTQDSFAWFNDNPYIKTIVTVFGSISTFVIVIIVLLRKQGKAKLKELLSMESDRDKPQDVKSQHEDSEHDKERVHPHS